MVSDRSCPSKVSIKLVIYGWHTKMRVFLCTMPRIASAPPWHLACHGCDRRFPLEVICCIVCKNFFCRKIYEHIWKQSCISPSIVQVQYCKSTNYLLQYCIFITQPVSKIKINNRRCFWIQRLFTGVGFQALSDFCPIGKR